MSNAHDDGGPAFPQLDCFVDANGERPVYTSHDGMTLRDYFAAKSIQGFLSQSHAGPKDWTEAGHGWGEDCANDLNRHRRSVALSLADFAYQVADAMLKARQA